MYLVCKTLATAAARFTLKFQLLVLFSLNALLSVWPSIKKLTSGCAFNNSAMPPTIWIDLFESLALPLANMILDGISTNTKPLFNLISTSATAYFFRSALKLSNQAFATPLELLAVLIPANSDLLNNE